MKFSRRMSRVGESATGRITRREHELRAEGRSLVGFGAGEPHFATPPKVLDAADREHVGKLLHINMRIQQGIESLLAKKIVKMIKDKKLKVQAQIQGEKVRVTGKKRDDLQQVMAMLKEAELEVPLQYNNFRD